MIFLSHLLKTGVTLAIFSLSEKNTHSQWLIDNDNDNGNELFIQT